MYEKHEIKPEILKYETVHVSSEDSNYAYAQRGIKDPEFLHSRGWVSSKYCNFPQEVVLKLRQRSNVERIELLCHHLYIRKKILYSLKISQNGIDNIAILTQTDRNF